MNPYLRTGNWGDAEVGVLLFFKGVVGFPVATGRFDARPGPLTALNGALLAYEEEEDLVFDDDDLDEYDEEDIDDEEDVLDGRDGADELVEEDDFDDGFDEADDY